VIFSPTCGGGPLNINISSDDTLNKYDATAPPGVTDDLAAGYTVGSHWIDVTADEAYICVDSTNGAAVWLNVSTGVELAAHLADTANPHTVTFTQAVAADGATDISAAEAETLTDTSDADALHVHSIADAHIADASIHKEHPATTIDNTLARFDGVTGDLQESEIVVDDSDNMSAVTSLAVEGDINSDSMSLSKMALINM